MAKLKLTPAIQTKIVQALQAGNFCDAAATAAGLSESTFWRYMEQGEDVAKARAYCEEDNREFKPSKTDEALLDFWEAVTRARAEAEVTAVAYVRKAMPEDWKAAMTFLERAFPKKWGKRLQAVENPEEDAEMTRAAARLVADAIRNTFASMGKDTDDPEVKAEMREVIERALGA
jgi:transposase